MEILFIRHAQPAWFRHGVSANDPPITELGQRQAHLLAEHLAADPKGFTELLASPMERARQTAGPIIDRTGLEPTVRAWLAEIGMPPDFEGATEPQIEEVFRQARVRPPEEWWDGLPDGESFADFHQRVTSGLESALAEREVVRFPDAPPHLWHVHRPDQRILVVAHNGTNSVALGHLLGVEPVPWEWERFVLRHASVARVKAVELAGGWVWSLRSFSDVQHLPPDMRSR